MGKACAYTLLVVVCLGVGVLIGGLSVYYSRNHIENFISVTTRQASCLLREDIRLAAQTKINGFVTFNQPKNMPITIRANVSGLDEQPHGFHIHTFGVIDYNCSTAGGHFNPRNQSHGGPESSDRHVGDLGNIQIIPSSENIVEFTDSQATLFGEDSIIGRSIVIHEKEDNLKSASSAGSRIACCTIQKNSNI